MHKHHRGIRERPDRTRQHRERFGRLLWPVLGFASLAWFLIRVIPKPSRAAYPCQRAAFPLASGFVLWVVGLLGTGAFLRKSRQLAARARPVASWVCFLLCGLTAVLWFTTSWPVMLFGDPWAPSEPPCSPIGTPRGVKPGRVVWVHDPDATSWDGGSGTNWWQDGNTDASVVSNMLSRSLRWLAAETSDADAWDALFRHFNRTRGRGDVGYAPGEKIAIKLNLNKCTTHGTPGSGQNPSPQLVRALLAQLVYRAGVTNQTLITVGDPSRYVGAPIWDMCTNEFPNVCFVDRVGGNGRIAAQPDMSKPIYFGDTNTYFHGATYLPQTFVDADYIINLGLLRGHSLAGLTITAKNHFGSLWVDWYGDGKNGWTPSGPDQDQAKGLHGYMNPSYSSWLNLPGRPMGSYNALVDLMAHKHLGEKTLLFLVDGLYAAYDQASGADPIRWQSEPFTNDWTSSLFVSQDGVAIDSVALDFIRGEAAYEPLLQGSVDNFLHEAALADNPPSGTFYDPEGDGLGSPGLGVHEHWNNATNRQYSRNLGTGWGIELVRSEAEAYADAFVELAGLVVMEAEEATEILPSRGGPSCQWQTTTSSPAYSGTAAMVGEPTGAMPGNSTNAPCLNFRIRFEAPGDFAMWVRMLGSSPTDDSVNVGLDNQPITMEPGMYGVSDTSMEWHWENCVHLPTGNVPVTVSVPSAGYHTLNVWLREGGTIVDKIVLARDPAYRPTGHGPTSSPVISSEADGLPWIAPMDTQRVLAGATNTFPVIAVNPRRTNAVGLTTVVLPPPLRASFVTAPGIGSVTGTLWCSPHTNGTFVATFSATNANGATELQVDVEAHLPALCELNESVDNTTNGLPAGWLAIAHTNAADNAIWQAGDPGARGNRTGGSGDFVVADYDAAGRVDMYTDLYTPALDFGSWKHARLHFKTYLELKPETEAASVDVCTNGMAGPWTTVWERHCDRYEPVDLDLGAGGETNVVVRFRFEVSSVDWTSYWQIDDVQIYGWQAWDPDGDGLPSWWVNSRFGVGAVIDGQADEDGDGLSNADEYFLGTHPGDPGDALLVEGLGGDMASAPRITWKSSCGLTYEIKRTTNLASQFTTLATNIPATPPTNAYEDADAAGLSNAFYRILAH